MTAFNGDGHVLIPHRWKRRLAEALPAAGAAPPLEEVLRLGGILLPQNNIHTIWRDTYGGITGAGDFPVAIDLGQTKLICTN
jgi:hypothetical protein